MPTRANHTVKPVQQGKVGRPVEKPEPDSIPDSPENVLRALVTAPPRAEDEWDYLKREPRPTGD